MRQAWALMGFLICATPLVGAEPEAKPEPAKGQSIVNKVCAACHGADGNSPTAADTNGKFKFWQRKKTVQDGSAVVRA